MQWGRAVSANGSTELAEVSHRVTTKQLKIVPRINSGQRIKLFAFSSVGLNLSVGDKKLEFFSNFHESMAYTRFSDKLKTGALWAAVVLKNFPNG